mgnify:CR=1 FL=1
MNSIKRNKPNDNNRRNTSSQRISSFHVNAFILKATLTAEWTTEKEFDRPSTAKKDDTINDTVNAKVLSEALGTSVITIKRNLYVLRDMNLIKYVGSNKTGHWEIVR